MVSRPRHRHDKRRERLHRITDERVRLAEQTHAKPVDDRAFPAAGGGKTFRPDHHKRNRGEELPGAEPAHVRLHLVVGTPEVHGGLIDGLQPHPVDEDVRDEDRGESGGKGEEEAFGIHRMFSGGSGEVEIRVVRCGRQ